jgi:epoxyqueuosine reductase
MSLSAAIKEQARALDFARVGILRAAPSLTHPFYEAWLERGYAGEMGYLHRHREAKRDPREWMEGARSLICLAMPYGGLTPHPPLSRLRRDLRREERGSLRTGRDARATDLTPGPSPLGGEGSFLPHARGNSSRLGEAPRSRAAAEARTTADAEAGQPLSAKRRTEQGVGSDPLRGRVSRYAWGRDYHQVIGERLERLAAFIQNRIEQPLRYRTSVDAQPLMEREWAARAGLGWVGKNAMLIDWELGSYLFLAELLVDIELEYDPPEVGRAGGLTPRPHLPRLWREPRLEERGRPASEAEVNRGVSRKLPSPFHGEGPGVGAGPTAIDLGLRESCGTCRACIDACPTQAIVADKTVDARRCISYLTIELKGAIPRELRQPMGDWVFGCDICQEVCPWNRRADAAGRSEPDGDSEAAMPSLAGLLDLDEAGFRERFRHSAIWRTRRRGLARNAAIALGNAAPRLEGVERWSAVNALEAALADAEPVVRGAAAWALGRFRERAALRAALATEADAMVRGELESALAKPGPAV